MAVSKSSSLLFSSLLFSSLLFSSLLFTSLLFYSLPFSSLLIFLVLLLVTWERSGYLCIMLLVRRLREGST
jgi:hypothetical protein